MLNKKGLIAVDELRGILTFMIIAVILLLLFLGCQVAKAKTEYGQIKVSKNEFHAVKALNRFLETPVSTMDVSGTQMYVTYGNKTYDIIDGHLKDMYSTISDPASKNEFRRRMNDVVTPDSLEYKRMLVLLPGGVIAFDSSNPKNFGTARISEGVALLPVSQGLNNFYFVEIELQ